MQHYRDQEDWSVAMSTIKFGEELEMDQKIPAPDDGVFVHGEDLLSCYTQIGIDVIYPMANKKNDCKEKFFHMFKVCLQNVNNNCQIFVFLQKKLFISRLEPRK